MIQLTTARSTSTPGWCTRVDEVATGHGRRTTRSGWAVRVPMTSTWLCVLGPARGVSCRRCAR